MKDAENITYIRIVRIVRTVRILRILRIMRFFRSLRVLVYSVLNTLRSLGWTILLLLIIMYLFGILFTQATTQHVIKMMVMPEDESSQVFLVYKHYGSLPKSIY